ncbi:MAG: hypothetical protein RO257_12440 [Candidatus Kapabacteria bacterium]|nr:hypothetical protein [Candidatus Kapabacteria bacterium]
MKTINFFFSVFAVILLSFVFNSCIIDKESYIINGSKYVLTKEDRKYQLDSFKVVSVIDNRKIKDSIIGKAHYTDSSLILNRPLPNFIRMMFNTLICKDSTKTDIIPLTVNINEFFTETWGREAYHKFDYLFEYPFGSEKKKLRIIDSIEFSNSSNTELRMMMINGVVEAARIFSLKSIQMRYLDSLKLARPDTTINLIYDDTVDLRIFRKFKLDWKIGLLASYNYGLNTKLDYTISFIDFWRNPETQKEVSSGLGFQYCRIDNKERYGEMYGLVLYNFKRYKIFKAQEPTFWQWNYSVVAGLENNQISNQRFYIGLRLEESIIINPFNFLTINFGLYQQGYLLSRLLPYDAGITLSVYLNSGY